MAPGNDSPSVATPQPLVLEVFSNSEKAWHVGIVMGAQDGLFTVRFLGAGGEKRQKAAFKQDPMFAQFGTYIGDQLPPGVVKVPSTTRPGQYSFFDQSAQRKFATLELVWHAYLEKRLIDEEASPRGNSQPMAIPTLPIPTAMHSVAPVSSPVDQASLSPRPPPTLPAPPAAARSTPEGPMVTPKGLGSSGVEPASASADRDAYRPEGPVFSPEGPVVTPRGASRRGAPALPPRNFTHVGPGMGMPPATQAFGSDNSRGQNVSLREWAAQYVHQPVLTTASINYLNQISIVFASFAELFSPLAAENAPNRERIIHAIESGAFMHATVDVFEQWDTTGKKSLTWENGVIQLFVTAVFTQYGLIAPLESRMQAIFQAFDVKKQLVLGARECVLLVDAVARTIFRINPAPGAAEERAITQPVMFDVEVIEPPQLDVKQVDSPCELHGLELMKALSAALAGQPLAALLGGGFRRNDQTKAGPVQPLVYSNLADKGTTTGPTQVVGVGLVEGATSIARLLVQRVPTSVLSGSAEGNAVRQRLQQKVATMQAAAARHQAAAAAAVVVPS